MFSTPDLKFIPFQNLKLKALLQVLEWRNHPEIRKWMNNTGLISQEEHLNYIERLRSDISIQAYLGYERDTPVGVLNINGSKKIELPVAYM